MVGQLLSSFNPGKYNQHTYVTIYYEFTNASFNLFCLQGKMHAVW